MLGGATPVAVDLYEPDAGERAVAAAIDAFGGLDVLVNNVGVARIASFEQLSDDDWQQAWELNVMSYVRCIRAALPALRESRSPAIVNVASTSGKRPSTGMPHYTVTKAAVLSLSRELGVQFCEGTTVTGLSLAGHAHPIQDRQKKSEIMGLLVSAYEGSTPPPGPLPGPDEVCIMRVEPKVISLLDYSKGFGHTDLVAC